MDLLDPGIEHGSPTLQADFLLPVHQGSPYVYFTALKKKTKFGIWSCCCYLVTQLGPTLCDPWTATCQASLSFTSSQRLLKLMSIEPVMPSNHLILCCPLLFLPSTFPSIMVFSTESALRIWWPKCQSFSFSISPSTEYSGLISFRIVWFDLLSVQGTLKSLFQHHSWKVSILWCSDFLMVQLSHPYMTTGKTTALTRQTFVGKVMSLLFNMLTEEVRTTILWPPK